MPDTSQLSFDVEPHPNTRHQDGSVVPLYGELKWSVAVDVDHDLQPGDQVVVTVASADGEVLGTSLGKVEDVAFKTIKEKGRVIAQVREHKVKSTDA